MLPRQILTAVVILACALALAACGGGDAPAPAPTAGGTAPAPAVDPNAALTGAAGTCDPVTNPAACGADPGATGPQAPLPEGDGHDVDGGLSGLDGSDDVFGALAVFKEENLGSDPFGTAPPPGGTIPGGTSGSGSGSGSAPTSKTTVTYGPATISLDGEVYTVSKGTIFPTDAQLFQVTRIGGTSVDIDLVAGEFSSGSTGITLYKGKTATLVNDSEGITYELKLTKVTATSTTTYSGGSCGLYGC